MSQQSLRQASIRAVTSTTYTYEGDWHALWDLLGIAAGTFNERMLLYINNQLSTSYTELNSAMAAFAAEHGSTTFQAIGTFTPGFSLTALTLAWSTAASDNTPGFSVSGDSLDVAPVGAQIELQVSTDVDFTPPLSDTELSAVTGNPVSISVSPALSDGPYWVRARLLDSGDVPLTDWSNVATETIATTSAEVTQYLDRATGMDATHVAAFTALIDGLVADAVWSELDALYIFATDTQAHARLNVKSTSFPCVEGGSPAWTADQGYTGTLGSSTVELNTGFAPSTAGGVYLQDSAHFSLWVNNSVAAESSGHGISLNGPKITPKYINNNTYMDINVSFGNSNMGAGTAQGHHIGSRTASNLTTYYKNGSSVTTSAAASVTRSASSVLLLRSTTGGDGATHQLSAATLGAGLDATKAAALYNRIATYRTAVGL